MLTHTSNDKHSKHNRPNILWIITDQQRFDSVGYVNPFIKTPNIDKLANSGIVCNNAYVQSQQCQPSRASMLTGRYPSAHKVWWNQTPLSKSEKTIANYLKPIYQTAYFGKIHLTTMGDSWNSLLSHFGFDHNFIFWDWVEEAKKSSAGRERLSEMNTSMSNKTWTGKFSHREMYYDDVIAEKAVSYMQNCNQPYFVMVGFHGPHPPYACPPPYNTLYDPKQIDPPIKSIPNHANHQLNDQEWQKLKAQYYGSISLIDENVGKLIAASADSIIIFTSDHGDILGDHGLFSKGMYAYDGNSKVPMVFKIPGVENKTYEGLVQSIDIMPTILEITGINKPIGIQGKSLLKSFKNDTEINEYVLSMVGYLREHKVRMVRNKVWKYWLCNHQEFLFNMLNDPKEMHNLSKNESCVGSLNHMRLLLIEALISAEDMTPAPIRL